MSTGMYPHELMYQIAHNQQLTLQRIKLVSTNSMQKNNNLTTL